MIYIKTVIENTINLSKKPIYLLNDKYTLPIYNLLRYYKSGMPKMTYKILAVKFA